jgi:hypothetical protein
LERIRGTAVAKAFYQAVTTESLTLREGLDAWLAEAARGSTRKTIDGHRRVFTELETWLRERRPDLSLEAMTFADISRRIAGEFIAHRSSKVSVELHQGLGGFVGAAGGKAPGLLHRCVLHAQHGTDLVALGGHQGTA